MIGPAAVFALLRSAAGRHPHGTTETILQADAESRAVFSRSDHQAWDGEVRIIRQTDPRMVKQVQHLNNTEQAPMQIAAQGARPIRPPANNGEPTLGWEEARHHRTRLQRGPFHLSPTSRDRYANNPHKKAGFAPAR